MLRKIGQELSHQVLLLLPTYDLMLLNLDVLLLRWDLLMLL
jgi:hypothetical protein